MPQSVPTARTFGSNAVDLHMALCVAQVYFSGAGAQAEFAHKLG